MNFTCDSGQWVFGFIIMKESELNLSIRHRWNKLSLRIEDCQVDNDHDQEYNKNDSIGVELIHEDFQAESG